MPGCHEEDVRGVALVCDRLARLDPMELDCFEEHGSNIVTSMRKRPPEERFELVGTGRT